MNEMWRYNGVMPLTLCRHNKVYRDSFSECTRMRECTKEYSSVMAGGNAPLYSRPSAVVNVATDWITMVRLKCPQMYNRIM